MHSIAAARPDPTRALAAGLVLVAPGALFLALNVLHELGVGFLGSVIDAMVALPLFNAVSPVVFLGGLTATLLLNALAIAQLDVRREGPSVVATLSVQPRRANLALITVVTLMLAVFITYAFVENFSIVQTHAG